MERETKTLEDARIENYIRYLRSREPGNINQRYVAAGEKQDVEEAAEAAREWRNCLLADCDSMMVPDRPGVNVPSGVARRPGTGRLPVKHRLAGKTMIPAIAIIEKQNQIIQMQSQLITDLYNMLAQHTAVDDLEKRLSEIETVKMEAAKWIS